MTDQIDREFNRIDRQRHPKDYKPKKPYGKEGVSLFESRDYALMEIAIRSSAFRDGYQAGLKEGQKTTDKAIDKMYKIGMKAIKG